MKNTAHFITFEGIEGCGKSTQVKLLAEKLKEQAISVVLTREPGGTRIGDQIRKIVLHADNTDMDVMAELLLNEASRAQHVTEVILPNIENGVTVICDRYGDASVAYQGAGRGLDVELVKQANELATGGLQPDVTILLDIEPELGLQRARARNLASNFAVEEGRFEEEDIAFHRRVREGYMTLLNEEPERFHLIDGRESIEEVNQSILEAVLPLFDA